MSTSPAPATFEQANAAWLAERNTFIGGSECYHLFNIPQYGTGCERFLAYKKLGYPIESEYSHEDEALLKRGHLFEPLAASLYEDATGRKVRRPPGDKFGFSRARRHPKYPFLGVHTDRMILAGFGRWTDDNGREAEPITETGDLELKSHGEGMFLRIMREGVPKGHILQIQHSVLVNERERGSLGIVGVFGGLPMKYADARRDEKIHDAIVQVGTEFWNKIERKELPDRLADENDVRCQVCTFRMECRGQEVDAQAVRFVHAQRKTDKRLLQITTAEHPELVKDLTALQLLKDEVRTLDHDNENEPGAIQILEKRVLEAFATMGLGKDDKPFVPGVTSCALVPSQFNGIDQKKFKDKYPDAYRDCYVSGRFTGKLSLRLYKMK